MSHLNVCFLDPLLMPIVTCWILWEASSETEITVQYVFEGGVWGAPPVEGRGKKQNWAEEGVELWYGTHRAGVLRTLHPGESHPERVCDL